MVRPPRAFGIGGEQAAGRAGRQRDTKEALRHRVVQLARQALTLLERRYAARAGEELLVGDGQREKVGKALVEADLVGAEIGLLREVEVERADGLALNVEREG